MVEKKQKTKEKCVCVYDKPKIGAVRYHSSASFSKSRLIFTTREERGPRFFVGYDSNFFLKGHRFWTFLF